jgi:hypothetical protein
VAACVGKVTLVGWISVLVGAGALVFAYLAWRVSQKQLRLAQEQAKMRPELAISEMQLIELREAGLDGHYIVSYQKEKVQREQDIQRGVQPTSPPPPDRVLRFKLYNRGRVAATHVTGKLFFPATHLQPPAMVLPTASFGYGVSEEPRDGDFVVRMSPLAAPLLPGDDPVIFDIAVSVRAAGSTSVRYEYGSAEVGLLTKGEVKLEVPPA